MTYFFTHFLSSETPPSPKLMIDPTSSHSSFPRVMMSIHLICWFADALILGQSKQRTKQIKEGDSPKLFTSSKLPSFMRSLILLSTFRTTRPATLGLIFTQRSTMSTSTSTPSLAALGIENTDINTAPGIQPDDKQKIIPLCIETDPLVEQVTAGPWHYRPSKGSILASLVNPTPNFPRSWISIRKLLPLSKIRIVKGLFWEPIWTLLVNPTWFITCETRVSVWIVYKDPFLEPPLKLRRPLFCWNFFYIHNWISII